SHTKELLRQSLEATAGVERVVPILQPFKLVSREFKPENTVVDVKGVRFGDGTLAVIAGPCSVEGLDQIVNTAKAVKAAGAGMLRAVPVLEELSHPPVISEPSQGAGKRKYVSPRSRAAVAAGAAGLSVAVQPDPEKARGDGPQQLTPEHFRTLMAELDPLTKAL